MPDTVADSSLVKQDGAAGRGDVALPGRNRRRVAAGPWIAGLCWAAALGSIWLAAANFRAVSVAADQVEELARLSPVNQVGRGACAAFARTQPPIMFDPDSECWINLTQQQYRDGTIRPHDFPFDNAPYGRERHWSSSFSWWLLLLAAVPHGIAGLPMETAIADVAPWANPVLFACFVTALALVLRRKMGAWPTGTLILTLTTMAGVEWDFSSGHPDHHGLHLMAFTGLFLGALLGGLGWVRVPGNLTAGGADGLGDEAPGREKGRFWLMVSGVSGGIGLWIGSTQQIICIGALGAGAVLSALCFARPWSAATAAADEDEARPAGGTLAGQFGTYGRAAPAWVWLGSRFEPELWRHWSRVGAGTSLFFYLLEYFPHHLEMRPEVNHPLIALGWAGAGELMWIFTLAKVDWPAVRSRRRNLMVRAVLGLLALAALPLAIVLGPRTWFVLGNPILRWSAAMISEGQPWLDPRHPTAALFLVWTYTGVLSLSVPLAVVLLIWREIAPWRRGALLTLLLATAVFLGWTLLQNRWIGFLEISLILLTLAAVSFLPISAGRSGVLRPLILLAFFLPGWLAFGVLQARTRQEDPQRHAAALLEGVMATKEAAWNLALYSRGENRSARVMAPPGPSPTLHYYGGVDTVGSYYWENLSGCQAAIDFYNDTGDAEARRIVRERGLDFVMAVAQPSFVLEMQMLKTGKVNVAAARHTLAFRLSNPHGAVVPDWLERLPLLDAPLAQADGIRLYRVRRDRL